MRRSEAIEFCRERQWIHLNGAEEIRKNNDLMTDMIVAEKYYAQVDLSHKYARIASLLEMDEEDEHRKDDGR